MISMATAEARSDADGTLIFHSFTSFYVTGRSFRSGWRTNTLKRWWATPELGLNAELRSLRAMCKPASIVFDVGAHHGMTAVLCAR
jgi:hypothetical protein